MFCFYNYLLGLLFNERRLLGLFHGLAVGVGDDHVSKLSTFIYLFIFERFLFLLLLCWVRLLDFGYDAPILNFYFILYFCLSIYSVYFKKVKVLKILKFLQIVHFKQIFLVKYKCA